MSEGGTPSQLTLDRNGLKRRNPWKVQNKNEKALLKIA